MQSSQTWLGTQSGMYLLDKQGLYTCKDLQEFPANNFEQHSSHSETPAAAFELTVVGEEECLPTENINHLGNHQQALHRPVVLSDFW